MRTLRDGQRVWLSGADREVPRRATVRLGTELLLAHGSTGLTVLVHPLDRDGPDDDGVRTVVAAMIQPGTSW